MQHIADPKDSPSNRRQTPGQARPSSKKVYASESDLPSHKTTSSEKRNSPSTPRKPSSGGGPAQQGSATTAQKQRKQSNKNRNPKNGATSPGRRQQQDRASPAVYPQDTPAPIFAGSTFHASPAPTSLPIPSFLGRPSTDRVATSDTEATQDTSPPSGPDESPTEKEPPPRRHDESPLEFFFRADRAEKERVRRGSAATTGFGPNVPFSPPRNDSSDYSSSPRGVAGDSAHRPSFVQRNTSPAMSTSNLDGSSRPPIGPAFSTPYHERIRAVRSNLSPAQAKPVPTRNLDPNSSEALKRYLFTGQLGRSESEGSQAVYSSSTPELTTRFSESSTQSAPQPQGSFPSRASYHSPHSTPSRPQGVSRGPFSTSYTTQPSPGSPMVPGYAPHAQPISPAMTEHSPHAQDTASLLYSEPSPRPDHLIALEGSLRRILNLDSRS
ncbi:hypothetical protein F5Y17DRAFT_136533 [Xylariaceae sp. FL0594]|nr:hypothetical protein F5Y17DRAFT_136533 [Xylariaceae sp. FL0594]